MERDVKKIAIIINCYNYEDYIRSAIESALAQDQNLCEIIIVDDGSTDNSWNIIKTFPLKSYRIPNGGQVGACFFGVQKTASPFVMFLDADDELMPDAISKLLPYLNDDVSKIQFPLLKIDKNGSIAGSYFPKLARFRDKKTIIKHIRYSGTYLSPPTSGNVFRRDLCMLLEAAHYDTAVDGITLLAAPFLGYIISLDTPLGRYRIHGKNKSGVGKTSRDATMRLQQERFINRIAHLNNLCLEREIPFKTLNPEKMYIFIRYKNYRAILNHDRVAFRDVMLSIRSFPTWYGPFKRLVTVFYLLSSLIISKRVLAYLLELRLSGRWRHLFQDMFLVKKI